MSLLPGAVRRLHLRWLAWAGLLQRALPQDRGGSALSASAKEPLSRPRSSNPSKSALYSRRHEERRRNGITVAEGVEVDRDGLTALIEAGLLNDNDADNRVKVGQAVSAHLRQTLVPFCGSFGRVRIDPRRSM